MKTAYLVLILGLLSIAASAQEQKRKNVFPLWSYHQKNLNIHGLSLGLWSLNSTDARNTFTNGVKLELVGIGVFIPLIPKSPIVSDDVGFEELLGEPVSERINGLNLSGSGSACHCVTNGLQAGLIGQIGLEVNGISMAFLMNFVQKQNGIQLALFNESYQLSGFQMGVSNYGAKSKGVQLGGANFGKEVKGVQIGLYNKAEQLKGIQFGLWNENQKRKLPLINWNFNKKAKKES